MLGRAPTPEAVERVTERYRQIGGGSPAPGLARSIAQKLGRLCGLPVYIGMLHWHPLVEEAVPQLAADGVAKALVICLAPHFSPASVGRYHSRAVAASSSTGIVLDLVDSWHTETRYVDAIAASINEGQGALSTAETAMTRGRRPAHVLFAAHSLPLAAMGPADPYRSQLLETAVLVAGRLGLDSADWTLAYQSVAGPREKWLGPTVEEILAALASEGTRQVVVCPFGFVLDQVETLYDLDVVLKAQAQEWGVELVRTPALNDSAPLVETLAGLVQDWLTSSDRVRHA